MRTSVIAVGLILLGSPTFATVHHVPSEYTTIQAAIDACQSGDTVLVAPGTYRVNIVFGQASILLMSSGGDSVTILTPASSYTPILKFPFITGFSNTSTVIGFTIQGAAITGVSIDRGNAPTIYDCTIRYNHPDYEGGGLACAVAGCLIRRCRFIGNYTSYEKGGGIYLNTANDVVVDSCIFLANHAYDGGGAIAMRNCSGVIIRSNLIIYNMVTDDFGGVVYSEASDDVQIYENTIVGNDYNEKNAYYDYGDGVGITIVSGTNTHVFNNIIAFNTDGYGIYVYGDTAGLRIEYNDVYQNTLGGCSGISPDSGSFSLDPEFVSLIDSIFTLLPTSPCINTGDPSPEYNDPDGSRSDLGAFSYDLRVDVDLDGVMDLIDNCRNLSNPDQSDIDGDGLGDACDPCPDDTLNDVDNDGICGAVDPCPYDSLNDIDGDGLCGEVDNCPFVYNAGQENADGDSLGDACDSCPLDSLDDIDGDGLCADVDPCPFDSLNDIDSDGHCAEVDNCPLVSNPDQSDGDSDGVGDACDLCPTVYDPTQPDWTHDGIGDSCCCVLYGDYDHSGSVNVADLTALVARLFCGGMPPPCPAEKDVNGSGAMNVSDLTFLVAYLFESGAPPPPCPDY